MSTQKNSFGYNARVGDAALVRFTRGPDVILDVFGQPHRVVSGGVVEADLVLWGVVDEGLVETLGGVDAKLHGADQFGCDPFRAPEPHLDLVLFDVCLLYTSPSPRDRG